ETVTGGAAHGDRDHGGRNRDDQAVQEVAAHRYQLEDPLIAAEVELGRPQTGNGGEELGRAHQRADDHPVEGEDRHQRQHQQHQVHKQLVWRAKGAERVRLFHHGSVSPSPSTYCTTRSCTRLFTSASATSSTSRKVAMAEPYPN